MTEIGPSCTCITCSDQAIEMLVVSVDDSGIARCADPEGNETDIDVLLVDGVAPGVRLMAHAGTAIALAPKETA